MKASTLLIAMLTVHLGIPAGAAFGQAQGSAPVPALTLRYLPLPPPASDSVKLVVKVELAPGWAINSHAPLDEFLVPTALSVASDSIVFGSVRYPAPVVEHSAAMGGSTSLFKGTFAMEVPGKWKAGKIRKEGGKEKASSWPHTQATFTYQSCNGSTCFPPKTVSAVLEAGEAR